MDQKPTNSPDRIEAGDVPQGVCVHCPMYHCIVTVRTCCNCQHCHAVGHYNSDERIPWQDRHQVLCTFPKRLPIMVLKDA